MSHLTIQVKMIRSKPISDFTSSQRLPASSGCVYPTNAFIEFKKEEVAQSIPSRFEQQVDRYPNRTAIKTKSQELTYKQLNNTANRLAHALLSQPDKGERPIALLIEKGATLITAILSVLKIGKIYVVLEPSFPSARNAYILADSQAKLIVTNNKNIALARELAQKNCQLFNVDETDSVFSTDNIELLISPDALALIIYTSGSTGNPKGVVQSHSNVLHNCMINTNAYHINSNDRMTLLHSCSVLGGTRGIFNALLNGATLYPLNVKSEGLTGLLNLLIENGITVYHSVTTLFRYFANTLTDVEKFPKLRLIILGGEPVLKREVALYEKYFSSDCLLSTGLGSTETGTARVFIIDKKTEVNSNMMPPLGYEVEDKEILLLDDAGAEVDLGDIGEIAVKSRYLALNYWQNPTLTQAAFMPDPDGGNERIYRTGDLGRMLPDGCLVHLGRKDFQVKIRGYRIEVTEIEMALIDTGTLKEAIVLAHEDISGEKRLIAYVIPNQEPAPSIQELHRFLIKRLPDYMVPSTFFFLDTLPLTPGGKIDRRALPVPDVLSSIDTDLVPPRTPTEDTLATIWADILGLEKVGIYNNFFELGGHSLLATQVISQLLEAFSVEIPLPYMFEKPTIADMAVKITQIQAEKVVPEEEITDLLAELEGLSDEEAQKILVDER